MSQHPHQILGVPLHATEAEIKRAYREKAKRYHPDKNPSEQAAQLFRDITEAYETLLDPAYESPEIHAKHRDPGYDAPQSRDEYYERRQAAHDRERRKVWETRLRVLHDRKRLKKSGFYYPAMLATYGLYVGIFALAIVLASVPIALSIKLQSALGLLLAFPIWPFAWRIARRGVRFGDEIRPYFKK